MAKKMTPSKSTETEFYGDKLRLGRLINGFTQQELGELASVTRQYIHQLESGLRSPAEDLLHALCESLKVTPVFFQTPVGNDVKFEQCHFRRRKTTPTGLAHRAMAFSTIFETLVVLIKENLDVPNANIPQISSSGQAYTADEIECAAERCRKEWGLGIATPISRITRALENAGIFITHFSGVSEKIDALSINRRCPIIVRNTAKESYCRMRFDLAHECGHFVLHDGIETGDPQTESEANNFASAFIFPRSAFKSEFPDMSSNARLNWKVIYELKVRWGMSARAIVYRARQLDLLSAKQYRSANVYLNRTGQTKVERYDELVQPETPELLQSSLDLMRDELGISVTHLAKRLGVSIELLRDVTGLLSVSDSQLESNVIPLNFSKNPSSTSGPARNRP